MTLVFSNLDQKWLYQVYGQPTYPLDFDLTDFDRIRSSGYTTFSQNLSVTYILQLFIGPSVKQGFMQAHVLQSIYVINYNMCEACIECATIGIVASIMSIWQASR
jgi:hypothetical protein